MINFVLIEDNESHIKKVANLINHYMMKNKREYVIHTFKDYDEKVSKLIKDDDKYKIYILDFELPSATAIEVAREIRQHDWTSAIIVNSAYSSLAYETFKQRLQILDFVSKQIECEKNLIELFDICLDRFDIMDPIKLKIGHTEIRIFPNKILYFYRKDRKTFVVIDQEEYKISLSLSDLQSELNNSFVQTHKSCFINPKRIYKIDWKDKYVVFDNNKVCTYLSFNYYEELTKDEHN